MVLVMLVLCACSKLQPLVAHEPIVAGIDSPDDELTAYLKAMIQTARNLPKSALRRGQLAMAYDVNGFRDAALATYDQAESLDPDDFRWPYFSALLMAQKGLHEPALEKLQQALAIEADYPPAWLWRGSWLLDLGRPDAAAAAFERARDLGAGPAATFGRARVLIAQGQHAEAAAVLEPLAQRSAHPHIYRTLGQVWRALGRIEQARTALALGSDTQTLGWEDDRLRERTAYIRGYASFDFAQELSAAGRVDEALEILERLHEQHPNKHCGRQQDFFFTCNLLNSLSIAHSRADHTKRALEVVQLGLALNSEFIPFHMTIASYYRRQRDLRNALQHVHTAIQLNPMLGVAHKQKGRLLVGLGRPKAAKAAFETALRLSPGEETTLFYLGMVEAQLLNWPLAIERFERAVHLDPGLALGHVYLARSLGEGGRIQDARRALGVARQYNADPQELRATERRLRELEAAG